MQRSRPMLVEPAAVLIAGLATSACEPNRTPPRFLAEPPFLLGLSLAVLVGGAQFWAWPPFALGLQILSYALFFIVGYGFGSRLRRATRLRVVGLALLCVVVDALATIAAPAPAFIPHNLAARMAPFATVAGYLAIGASALLRLRKAPEPFLSEVERRIVAAATSVWYALDAAEARSAADRLTAYLGGGDLLTRAGLKVAVLALQWSPLFTTGRPLPFTALRPELQERHLVALERGKLLPLRYGLLAIRVVAGMLHVESRDARHSANPSCPEPAGV